MAELIYLDHAATTPLRSEARAAMQPWLEENYANPSSVYRLAQQARSAVDRARGAVAECLGARPEEIIFTSGGTEANNAAIKGLAAAAERNRLHLVTSVIEHHAVLHPVQELAERWGYSASYIPVESSGVVRVQDVEPLLRADTALLSVMWVNNEIGTIQPIAELARLARERGIPFHVDAVQAAGALPIDLQSVPVDLLSVSAHKFYGPKGVGALFVRRGTPWWPLLVGGGQERNRRSGTENVAGIVGMAEAMRLADCERVETWNRLLPLRDRLVDELTRRIDGTVVHGDLQRRTAHNVSLGFKDVRGESLLVALDLAGIMASSGSACTSGSTEASHVLTAIGVPDDLAKGALRLTLGRDTTAAEIDRVIETLIRLVASIRSLHKQVAP